MGTKTYSTLALFLINIQRVTDHTYRLLTGLPQMKRSEITPQIYVGGQYQLRAIDTLKKIGITGIINMRITSMTSPKILTNFHLLQLPTPDKHAPTLKDLQKGIAFINEEIKKGGKVYMHCRHGEGRGPTMAIAYLISTGIPFEDALMHVKKVRTFIRPTTTQRQRLMELEQIYLKD